MGCKCVAGIACLAVFLGTGHSQEKANSPDEQVKELIAKYRALSEKAQLGKDGTGIIKQCKAVKGTLSPRSLEAIARLEAAHNLRQIAIGLHNYDGKPVKPNWDPKTLPFILPFLEKRNQWEYKVCTDLAGLIAKDLTSALNKLGDEGWELVGFRKDQYIFKRPK